MKIPIVLVALGLVSFYPEAAVTLSDRLALFVPSGPIVRAASWLARYDLVGVVFIAAGVGLMWKRLAERPVKKLS